MIDLDSKTVLRKIKDKYYKYDISGYSDAELLEREANKPDDVYTMYTLKDEYDSLSATGDYAMWSNHEGGQVTMDLGSLGNECNIFEDEEKA